MNAMPDTANSQSTHSSPSSQTSSSSPSSQSSRKVKRGNFSDVDYHEAVRRAKAMVPFLKEQAAAQEATTHMTEAVKNAFHENGLFQIGRAHV
mgnify:FL=1